MWVENRLYFLCMFQFNINIVQGLFLFLFNWTIYGLLLSFTFNHNIFSFVGTILFVLIDPLGFFFSCLIINLYERFDMIKNFHIEIHTNIFKC